MSGCEPHGVAEEPVTAPGCDEHAHLLAFLIQRDLPVSGLGVQCGKLLGRRRHALDGFLWAGHRVERALNKLVQPGKVHAESPGAIGLHHDDEGVDPFCRSSLFCNDLLLDHLVKLLLDVSSTCVGELTCDREAKWLCVCRQLDFHRLANHWSKFLFG